MLGLGIDTGGTCTDAVIYDLESGSVRALAKTETTREDLKIGIGKALEALPADLLALCRQAALSTTLATNACVEGRGGRGKLILIGVYEKVFKETYVSYGIQDPADVLQLPCHITPKKEECTEPDWNAFREALPVFLADCDCVAIVQMYSAEHLGEYEKKAAEILRESLGGGNGGRYGGNSDGGEFPVVLGHSLFPDRNAIRRGAGALLNARLIPVLYEFITAVKAVFARFHIDLPLTIVRSDGSQMSEAFAAERPVETLLSGPAASVIGADVLASAPDALIVDMGGTTTDIAIIQGGLPKRAKHGIRVGRWKTFVKGLYIDTFGLGGDTAVRYDMGGKLSLEDYRIIPLCHLASRYPAVLETLRELALSGRSHPCPLHEFICLLRKPAHPAQYGADALALLTALEDGPLSLEQAAEAMGRDLYTMGSLDRLEKDGLILRAGLTPTDAMHLCGDYNAYCTEASRYAAAFFCRSAGIATEEMFCEMVYDFVVKRMYENILRILLCTQLPGWEERELDAQIRDLIEQHYQMAVQGLSDFLPFFLPDFRLNAKLVGVGAPIHIFLPRLAKLLHAEAVVPAHAAVANAIGAIAGQVVSHVEILLRPFQGDAINGYEVLSPNAKEVFLDKGAAQGYALQAGRALAEARCREQGASGMISFQEEWKSKQAETEIGSLWLEDNLLVTAFGKAAL